MSILNPQTLQINDETLVRAASKRECCGKISGASLEQRLLGSISLTKHLGQTGFSQQVVGRPLADVTRAGG